MEKFAEFVSSIGQNARSSPYMPSNGAIPRGSTSPNVPPVSYVSCDLARQHNLSLNTQSQAGNVQFTSRSFIRIVVQLSRNSRALKAGGVIDCNRW